MGDITDVRGAQKGWATRGHLGLTSDSSRCPYGKEKQNLNTMEGTGHKQRRMEESMSGQVVALVGGYI